MATLLATRDNRISRSFLTGSAAGIEWRDLQPVDEGEYAYFSMDLDQLEKEHFCKSWDGDQAESTSTNDSIPQNQHESDAVQSSASAFASFGRAPQSPAKPRMKGEQQ